jgi:hypothetical protein
MFFTTIYLIFYSETFSDSEEYMFRDLEESVAYFLVLRYFKVPVTNKTDLVKTLRKPIDVKKHFIET